MSLLGLIIVVSSVHLCLLSSRDVGLALYLFLRMYL